MVCMVYTYSFVCYKFINVDPTEILHITETLLLDHRLFLIGLRTFFSGNIIFIVVIYYNMLYPKLSGETFKTYLYIFKKYT